jgi:hypothetical protein
MQEQKKKNRTKRTVSVLVLAALVAFSVIGYAGNLEPPAAPGPTMKTLAEIEPGTPISSVPYTISEPGSYYLAANAQTTSNMFSGITIWANNVTLDLKGFSLTGDRTAGRHGVFIEGNRKNITIRNGTITNWGGNGVEAMAGTNCRTEDIRVIDNAGSGIHLSGNGSVVRNCVASDNGSWASTTISGISVGDGSVVTGNTANSNGTRASGDWVFGISVGEGGTVTGNAAYGNGYLATVTRAYGIFLLGYSLADQNTAYNNGTGADAAQNMTLNAPGCVYGNNVAP